MAARQKSDDTGMAFLLLLFDLHSVGTNDHVSLDLFSRLEMDDPAFAITCTDPGCCTDVGRRAW